MIAIDTNVLIRLFILDDLGQCAAARRLVGGAGPRGVFLTLLVLAETVRIYRRRLGHDRARTVELLDRIIEAPEFEIEALPVVEAALAVYRRGGVDFSDCLIAVAAQTAGAGPLYTFDIDAARKIPGAELLDSKGA